MKKLSKINFEGFKPLLAPRPRDAHKGLFGHILVIGGDYGMGGAACLAAEAALRIGAGLVSVATKKEHVISIISARPELMAYPVKQGKDITPLLAKASVVVIGPGLGQTQWSQQLFNRSLSAIKKNKPAVIDADGLNLLAKKPQRFKHWILTPHIGEAARLLNCEIKQIQANRIAAIKELQRKYDGIIVLKGAGTLVCSANSLRVCPVGNPGMASGGMGDVLSGIIGGLLAQHLTLQQAAELAVYLHGRAADLAALQKGERGLLASDLMCYLRQLINPLSNKSN